MEDDRPVAAFPDAPHINVPTEMRHCFGLEAVVDMFVGAGAWARMCVTTDVDYTGFCNNECHRAFVTKMLDDFVFDQIAVPGTPMYRETFAKAVQGIRERYSAVAGGVAPQAAQQLQVGGSAVAGGMAPQLQEPEAQEDENPEEEDQEEDPEENMLSEHDWEEEDPFDDLPNGGEKKGKPPAKGKGKRKGKATPK